jgi:hypothetical protein
MDMVGWTEWCMCTPPIKGNHQKGRKGRKVGKTSQSQALLATQPFRAGGEGWTNPAWPDLRGPGGPNPLEN